MSKRLRSENCSSSASNHFDKVFVEFVKKFRASIEEKREDCRPFELFKESLRRKQKKQFDRTRQFEMFFLSFLFFLSECLDEKNDSNSLDFFIRKSVEEILSESSSNIEHLVLTKIVGLIIIYVKIDSTIFFFSRRNFSFCFSVQFDNLSNESLTEMTDELMKKLTKSTGNVDA